VRVSSDPTGNFAASLLAPFGNALIDAGILTTTQCQNPDPVGASGSNIVSTKLLVPAGALVHESCGDTLLPLHPNVFRTWALAKAPVFRSVLVSVNVVMFLDGCAETDGGEVFAGLCAVMDVLKSSSARGAYKIACCGLFIGRHLSKTRNATGRIRS
jgi:hypothetical protein